MSKQHKDSVNDRMIKWTALPAVYLWLAASGSVVAMGIVKPDVVLENIEGFIALIAIIGGTAQPAFATMLEFGNKSNKPKQNFTLLLLNHKPVLWNKGLNLKEIWL